MRHPAKVKVSLDRRRLAGAPPPRLRAPPPPPPPRQFRRARRPSAGRCSRRRKGRRRANQHTEAVPGGAEEWNASTFSSALGGRGAFSFSLATQQHLSGELRSTHVAIREQLPSKSMVPGARVPPDVLEGFVSVERLPTEALVPGAEARLVLSGAAVVVKIPRRNAHVQAMQPQATTAVVLEKVRQVRAAAAAAASPR